MRVNLVCPPPPPVTATQVGAQPPVTLTVDEAAMHAAGAAFYRPMASI